MSAAPLRRVLIVSPHFPPINAPDLQRVRMSLPHYRACGWEPIVLCVGDAWQDGVREPGLADTLPPDIRIVRVPALPRRWTRLLGVGNLGLRCWPHFLFAGARLLRLDATQTASAGSLPCTTVPSGLQNSRTGPQRGQASGWA